MEKEEEGEGVERKFAYVIKERRVRIDG